MTPVEHAPSTPPSGEERRYGSTPFASVGAPSFDFEVRVIAGQEGVELRAVQARAIKELLTWLHAERTRPAGPRR